MKQVSNEREIVRNYCNHRALRRPRTNIAMMVLLLLSMEVVAITSSHILVYILAPLGITLSYAMAYVMTTAVIIWTCLKKICILCIELYQHYASERTRRKCTLMPSCSEYAIGALKKHGTIKGLYRIYIRLFKTCDGDYRVDYP